jgi:hypothetical protein
MAARYKPDNIHPGSYRLVSFTESEEPGQEMYDFKQNARNNDPFYMMGCRTGAKKHYIGDYIMMCVEPMHINIVIYRNAPLGSVKLLIKKLRYHLRSRQFKRAKLVFFGGRDLLSRDEIIKQSETALARMLFSISKRNTFTRLVLENSSGGPMSQEWFHTWKSRRVI